MKKVILISALALALIAGSAMAGNICCQKSLTDMSSTAKNAQSCRQAQAANCSKSCAVKCNSSTNTKSN